MDSVFVQGEEERAATLRHMMQSFGCTYMCLWSYLPHPSKCLIFLDGIYRDPSNQASSSSGSNLAQTLFEAYCQSVHYIDNGRVPGFAFKNNLPYMEMNVRDLQGLASNEVQLQFYGAAGIKTVVLMGCATGEIELGFSNLDPQVDFEMEMKNWFPVDFSRQVAPREAVNPQTTDQNRPGSSSSSSLRSLSVDNSFVASETSSKEPLTSPLHEAIYNLSQMRNVQLPTIENENTAMMKAILAVLSSSSSSSAATSPSLYMPRIPSAFSSYRRSLSVSIASRSNRKPNLIRRAMVFFRNLDAIRRPVQVENRPTSTQLHHMISERRRREKLNESFQVLRSFLPPGSKKDKASVLNNTVEYVSSLKKQVEELSKKNKILESQLVAPRSEAIGDDHEPSEGSTNVRVSRVSTSSSESRMLDVNVIVNGEYVLLDLVTRVMEFLKSQNNLSLTSVEANIRPIGQSANSVRGIMFRLRIEVDDFDESSFQEALKRVVDDLAR